MLYIDKYNSENNYITLKHNDNVFHEALSFVKKGEANFHVLNNNGEDYCLKYQKNEDIERAYENFPDAPLFVENAIFPDYFVYDETDKENIYMGIFDNYSAIYFQDINEYVVVIVKLLLKYTNKKVYLSDKRIQWFLEKEDFKRIIFVEQSEDITNEKIMIVKNQFVLNSLVGKVDEIDPICLFHNIFVFQYVISLSDHLITRLVINIPKTEGIGSILNNFFRIKFIMNKYGVELFLKSNCTRYSDDILKKYFNIEIENNDSENIYLEELFTIAFTYVVLKQKYIFDSSILSEEFLKDLKEYKAAILDGKRVLGVLVRGTDYIAGKMPTQALPIDELIPLIENTKKEGNFDYIFLATEDKDYYEKLAKHFKGQICAISQMRFSANELTDKSFLSDLESSKSKEEEYSNIVEDNLCNYFYAIYLLSECQGFLGMPPECNGVIMTKKFNKHRFDLFNVVSKKFN